MFAGAVREHTGGTEFDQEANLFRLTTLTYHEAPPRKHTPPPSLDPFELFLQPIWFKPYQTELVALLGKL